MEKIHKIAISYYECCVELKKIQEKIANIYRYGESSGMNIEGETDFHSSVYEDVKKIFESKREAIQDDIYGSENYRADSPINFYDDSGCKNSFELMDELFGLFDRRKELKNKKGKITRLLYLQGQSLGAK